MPIRCLFFGSAVCSRRGDSTFSFVGMSRGRAGDSWDAWAFRRERGELWGFWLAIAADPEPHVSLVCAIVVLFMQLQGSSGPALPGVRTGFFICSQRSHRSAASTSAKRMFPHFFFYPGPRSHRDIVLSVGTAWSRPHAVIRMFPHLFFPLPEEGPDPGKFRFGYPGQGLMLWSAFFLTSFFSRSPIGGK